MGTRHGLAALASDGSRRDDCVALRLPAAGAGVPARL